MGSRIHHNTQPPALSPSTSNEQHPFLRFFGWIGCCGNNDITVYSPTLMHRSDPPMLTDQNEALKLPENGTTIFSLEETTADRIKQITEIPVADSPTKVNLPSPVEHPAPITDDSSERSTCDMKEKEFTDEEAELERQSQLELQREVPVDQTCICTRPDLDLAASHFHVSRQSRMFSRSSLLKIRENEIWKKDWDSDSRTNQDDSDNEQIEDEDYSTLTLEQLNIISTIAMGTYANVKLVQCSMNGASLALKEVSKKFLESTRQTAMVLRERNIHRQLNHPFIARLYKTFQNQDCVYFLMEYLPGRDLWKLMCKEDEYEHGFPVELTRFYGACIVDAMCYLHSKNIMYRDMKLENIVLDRKGYPKLVDFGFATHIYTQVQQWERNGFLQNEKSTRYTTFCGSPEYMAPEIILHEGHNEYVDLYAFGILLYEMTFSFTPFYSQNDFDCKERILHEEVHFPDNFESTNPLLADLILLLLLKKPSDRKKVFPYGFASVKEHPFFSIWYPEDSDWAELRSCKVEPPFNPNIVDPFDLSRFSSIHDLDDFVEPYDGTSSWAKEF